uniref:Cytochrome b n=1 Tax=Globodera rostochiensis TaxID=31243 RepID=A0A914HQC4_GLORO
MDFAEWSNSIQIPIIYLSFFITIPSTALIVLHLLAVTFQLPAQSLQVNSCLVLEEMYTIIDIRIFHRKLPK